MILLELWINKYKLLMVRKYTLEIFLERAHQVHGDKYDYSQIKEEDIKGAYAKVLPLCRTCDYQWPVTIHSHINGKSGCPSCSGNVPWVLTYFLERARQVHGDKYDYSNIKEEDIKGAYTKVLPICRTCDYQWPVTIHSHINGKYGCPNCAGKAPWTLTRFLERGNEIHGNKYDYSQIKEKDINGYESKIPITCRTCIYRWFSTINNHISGKYGCPNCAGNAPWTLARFLERSNEIHGNKYDYSNIKEEDINGCESKVPLTCRTCEYQWYPSIGSHINQKTGCPSCRRSKGELAVADYLKKLSLPFTAEYTIESLPKKRYDFFTTFNNKKYLIEFDGQQHFEFVPFFHSSEREFIDRQETDITKTQKALDEDYKVIRIAYTRVDDVNNILDEAFRLEKRLYVSDPEMYKYLTNRVFVSPRKQFIKLKKY